MLLDDGLRDEHEDCLCELRTDADITRQQADALGLPGFQIRISRRQPPVLLEHADATGDIESLGKLRDPCRVDGVFKMDYLPESVWTNIPQVQHP